MPVEDEILRILANQPGADKRAISRALRTCGLMTDTSTVNSHLYSLQRAGKARKIDGTPPSWFACSSSTPTRSDASKTKAKQERREPRPPRLRLPGKPIREWQEAALQAWEKNSCRGVVQAVTGTGKTRLGLEACHAQLARGGKVLILVPSRALLSQWHRELSSLFGLRAGLRGDGHTNDFRTHDVLVSTVHSAMSGVPLHGAEGLLVADECHRYGAEQWSRALDSAYARRLGLSATYERGDAGDADYLHPYFGAGPVFDIAFDRAIREGVVVPFRLAFVGVPLDPEDQLEYDRLTERMSSAFGRLVNVYDLPPAPPAAFMKAVNAAAEGGSDATLLARSYTYCFIKRRALLADNPVKLALLARLEGVVGDSRGTLVFTQTKRAAVEAAARLADFGHHTAAIYGELDGAEREALLEAFRDRHKTVLSAPRVLDEGIDVPDADLGIIMAASSGRRQMIQRMGRVLRKAEGKRVARLVVFFAEGTNEDPAEGAHEGFMDLAWEVAEASEVFRGATARRLISFLST